MFEKNFQVVFIFQYLPFRSIVWYSKYISKWRFWMIIEGWLYFSEPLTDLNVTFGRYIL